MTQKKIILLFLLLMSTDFLFSCASSYNNPYLKLSTEEEYSTAIKAHTQKAQIYDGFMNTIDFSATYLDSFTLLLQLDQNARIYQWNAEQYSQEKLKLTKEAAESSTIFLSFYVPERKHDDLQKNTSKWKIFLDVSDATGNNKRFEGKVVRLKSLLSEIQSLYPHHNRWSTPYKLIFPVPLATLNNHKLTLVMTSPVGSAKVVF